MFLIYFFKAELWVLEVLPHCKLVFLKQSYDNLNVMFLNIETQGSPEKKSISTVRNCVFSVCFISKRF